MKKRLVWFAILPVLTWASDYHVDQASPEIYEDGSAAYPFRTIAQASGVMSAGDTCYIHRGIYRETVEPLQHGSSGSPIRYTAYSDDPVVVSGTEVVDNWQVHTGNVYKATGVNMPMGNKNMVFFNSEAMQLARWPNDLDGDPYTYDAEFAETGSGTYSDSYITNDEIPDYWTSGMIFWLGAHSGCSIQRSITGFDPGTHRLSFTPMPTGQWPFSNHSPLTYENGHRGIFYLLNRPEALDAPGEWYYDAGAQTLYFYAPGGVDPSTGVVEIAVRDKTLDLSKNYIEVEGLNLFGAFVDMGGHHCALENLRLRHCIAGLIPDIDTSGASTAGGAAVQVTGDDNRIERCLLEEGSSNGINVGGNADRTVIRNNIIQNFNQQGNHCCPIRSNGPDALIVSNRISGSARDVTRATGEGTVFSYNDVSDGLKACADGGLFYVTGNSVPRNVELSYNWFYDAYSPSYAGIKATGIYLDNDTAGYKVHHNVVWDVQWGGLHFNWDALENEIYNNTFWNVGTNEAVILCWVPDFGDGRKDVRDNTLINNLSDVRDWWDSGAGSYTEDETLDNVFSNNIQEASSPFVSIADKNFMPVNDPDIVDQGWFIAGVTDGHAGSAPDIGAYEYGGSRWVPGPDWTPSSFSWQLQDEMSGWIPIADFSVVGTNVLLSFTNGPVNGWIELQSKTNLMDTSWSVVQANLPVDATGAGSVTNPITVPQEFFRLFEGEAPASPSPVVSVITFTSPDYSDGTLDGQQNWNAEAGWIIGDSAGAGYARTDEDGSAAVLTPAVQLEVGERYRLSVNLEFGGVYSTPTNWVYTFLGGLKASNEDAPVSTGGDAADANIQIFKDADTYRLLNNYSVISGAENVTGVLDAGDILQFDYELILGVDAANTVYTVRLQNLTDGTDSGTGTVTGVDSAIYTALTGDGAYGFIQSISPGSRGSGLSGVQVNAVTFERPYSIE
ncbi:right-handed parallel beta-helix repeat-containing protein [Pontiella agarivorans]|uniref:Right-handed parallel beta-helix repeat-containing protein n=1 Tax=Pontiella agarivorans TaxID=3038953 RepID=A0ABU5MUA8_9BACT|nr:right-handed parallel beta-helix repeat-containing protein [Pontiella agarivorans]MDZ8117789.1 right-handed parallel beta-helix repeat-containing protein [Pontiella agarivorans]